MKTPHADPVTVYKRARVALYLFGVAAIVTGLLWLWPDKGLPANRMTMSLYLTLLLGAASSGCVMMLSLTQVAIHRAFKAGIETGQRIAQVDNGSVDVERAEDGILRVVK